jgi:hypothetical protein
MNVTGSFPKMLALGLIATTLHVQSANSEKIESKMQPISAELALQKFDELCVSHYLDRSALLERLVKDTVSWKAHKKLRSSDVRGGVYFESSVGELGHVIQTNISPMTNDPACHFTFVRDQTVTHKSLVIAATERFGLKDGGDTSSRIDGGQMRWDFQNVGPVPARIFVTSDTKANGRIVSRLSISRHRTPKV